MPLAMEEIDIKQVEASNLIKEIEGILSASVSTSRPGVSSSMLSVDGRQPVSDQLGYFVGCIVRDQGIGFGIENATSTTRRNTGQYDQKRDRFDLGLIAKFGF